MSYQAIATDARSLQGSAVSIDRRSSHHGPRLGAIFEADSAVHSSRANTKKIA